MEVKDIDINKIKQAGNVRADTDHTTISNLMSSIKQDGLLEPIGIQHEYGKDEYIIIYGNRRLEACKKLGWKTIPSIVNDTGKQIEFKDLMIQNTVENIQREDVSPVEQGRIFYLLKRDYKMTVSEIASRFGIAADKVSNAISIYNIAPDEYRDKIKFTGRGKRKKGNVPTNLAHTILTSPHTTKENIHRLFELAKQDKIQDKHIRFIQGLMGLNYTFDDAVKYVNKYTLYNLVVPINTEQLKDLTKRFKREKSEILLDILRNNSILQLDILSMNKLKAMPKKKCGTDIKISNGNKYPLTDSGSVVKEAIDDKLKRNWAKFRLK